MKAFPARLLAAALAAYILIQPALVQAQLPLVGAGGGTGFFGGASAAYDPQGVTFEPETQMLTSGALGVTNSTHFVLAWRARAQYTSHNNTQTADNWTAMLAALFGTNSSGATLCPSPTNTETCAGGNTITDNASGFSSAADGTAGTWRATFAGSGGVSTGLPSLVFSKANLTDNNAWHTWVMIADTSGAQNAKKVGLWKDGVKVVDTTAGDGTDGAGSLTIDWNNAVGFLINGGTRGSGNASGAFDLADLYLDVTHAIPSACVSGFPSDAACTALLAKFYDTGTGKPVDLGATCATPMGGQPDVCHHGDKTNFMTERGTASGAWSLFNPKAGGGSPYTPTLYNAPYSQGNLPTTRPYQVWSHTTNPTGPGAGVGTVAQSDGSSAALSVNLGNGIQTGDLVIAYRTICYTTLTINNAITTPSGWTLLPVSTGSNPQQNATNHCNYQVIYKIRTAASLPEGTPWLSSDTDPPPSLVFTPDGATNTRSIAINYTVIRGANVTTPIQASDAQMNASSTSQPAPALSLTASAGAPVLLLTACQAKANNTSRTVPSGEDLRYKGTFNVAANTFDIVADEVVSASGSSGAKTYTASTAVLDYCSSIGLVH